MTIEQLTRVTGYAWYGSGGHQSLGAPPYVFTIQGHDLVNSAGKWVSTIRALHRYNQRLFVDLWRIVPETTSANQSFTIKLNPTEQNFFYDDFLKLLHANGRNAIICPSGLFDWLVVPGYSQRKSACYDHSMSPSDPAAWKDFAHLFRLLAEYFKDKEYKVTLQFGNELDFRWNVAKILTPEEIAVGQWECIKAVMEVDPSAKMMLGCTLTPNMDTFNRYVGTLEQLAQAEGRALPQGLIWSDNHYVRDSGGNQGGGLADTPESQWEQTYVYRTQLNAACKQRGMKFEITEQGYSNSTSTSFAALKQKAPTLQGVSHDESPGVLWFRSMMMYASFSECTGVSRYHDKDGFESEPFTYIGVNYDTDFGGHEDWSDKPCKIYYESQLDLFGQFDVVKYQRSGGIYYATLSNGTTLHWSDKVNVGSATPIPTETTSIPQPMAWHPKKVGTELRRSDNNERIIIKGLNSPESLLRQPLADFKAIIDYAASVGLNEIYCSLYAGDKYSSTIHPYNGTKSVGGKTFGNPASGFNTATIADWKVKLEYAESKGMLLELLLSEKENHFVHTDIEQHTFIDRMVLEFGHLPIIWNREEFPLGKDSFIQNHFAYLRSKDANNIIAIHNNTGEKPQANHTTLIDLVAIQADVNSFDGIIKSETAKGFCAYSSEMTGGFQPNDTAKAATIRDAGGSLSSGCGVFIASLDQDATLAQLKTYEPVYKTISLQVVTPPNPTNMQIGYSTKADRTDFKEFVEGQSIAAGNIYIEARGVTPTVYLTLVKDGATIVNAKPENSQPYDTHGGQPYNATNGNYSITVKDKTLATKTVSFTVGTVTPPPTKEPVLETWVESGKVYFRTAVKTYSVAVQ